MVKPISITKILIFCLLLGNFTACSFLEVDKKRLEIIELGLPIVDFFSEEAIPYDHKMDIEWRFKGSQTHWNGKGKMRRRGGLSASYPKHSYTLKLKKNTQIGNFPSGNEWIFNANFIDKTFMRHKVCYDLFRQMNKRNIAPQSAYVHLYLNEEYRGLYVLMERLNEDRLQLDIESETAVIYKDPPIFTTTETFKAFLIDSLNQWQQNYPTELDDKREKHISDFRAFLLNSTDEQFFDFNQGIEQWIDLDSVTDWLLLLLFTNNSDGLLKNFFLYKKNQEDTYHIAIWDYDYSFGRDGDGEKNMFERMIKPQRNILFKRLMQNAKFLDRLKHRWSELRNNQVFSQTNLFKLIDDNHQTIEASIPHNRSIWKDEHKIYYDADNYTQELQLMKTFISQRLEQLDQYFNALNTNVES